MKYATEMGSGAMIYISSFIQIGSSIQKLGGGGHTKHGVLISLLLFFQNTGRLKMAEALSFEEECKTFKIKCLT
jgi:hypothetical protein